MDTRKTIEAAVSRFLYPVVKLLLEYGVSEAHFQNIARSVFVKVAAENIEKSSSDPGNKATATRIAVMTGVPRNAIKPILDNKHVVGQDEWYRHLCADVLTAWHTTTEYVDSKGNPLAIPFEGPAPSFEALTAAEEKRSRSSVSMHAILDELKLVGAVEEVPADPDNPDDGQTLLAARTRIFRRVGSQLDDLTAAMDSLYNLASAQREVMLNKSNQVLVGDIVSLDANKEESKVLLRMFRDAAESLLKTQKATMKRSKIKHSDDPAETRRVGIGVYVYADDEMKESPYFVTTIDEQEDQKLANE
jgi:hypothetical protein